MNDFMETLRLRALLGVVCSLALVAGTACSQGGDDEDSAADAGMVAPDAGASAADAGVMTWDGGGADPSVLVGSFQVRLVPPVGTTAGYSSVVGKVYSGATPSQLVWEQAAQEGECTLLTPRVPFCATPCGGSAVCVEDDTCQPYPVSRSAGTITVRGVHTQSGQTTFTMEPVANNYQPAEDLAFPAFSEGEDITFTAAGSAVVPAFKLVAQGVARLQELTPSLALARNQPLSLTWAAAGAPGLSTVHVKLDISHHGGSKGMVRCDTADTGALTIPAALVTQLLDLGVAGFPTIVLTRSNVGTALVPAGRVELVVFSDVEAAVTVPGLTSCNEDTDCPNGQTCQDDLSCQ